MHDDETETPRRRARRGESRRSAPALVLVWCPELPHRAGEVLVAGRGRHTFGRGTASLARLRPGEVQPTEPLGLRALSRVQLHVERERDGLRVVNEGRPPLLVDGRVTSSALVRPGQLVAIGDVLLFSCERWPEPLAGPPARHAFGEADDYGFVGESPAAWRVRERLAFLAPRDAHVLVLGESGTGKELAARALHGESERRHGPFVSRNAATMPEGLVDAEFFGNVANYPHSGMSARPGLVGMADGGTLFLDELGELPHALQTHLLRLLDSGEYQPLGGRRIERARLRVVAATNRPVEALKDDVAARFPLRITLPALRDRRTDVLLIARHVLRSIGERNADLADRFLPDGEPRITVPFAARLARHPFRTNVRELEQLLWRAMTDAEDDWLSDDSRTPDGSAAPPAGPPVAVGGWNLDVEPPEIPAEHVQACLDAHNGVQEETWRALGLPNRFALRRLIERHGLIVRKGPG